MADLARRVFKDFDRLTKGHDRIGIALSGGGDSVALMHLVSQWREGRYIACASVDHRLRPDSKSEARLAGQMARSLGFDHDILTWDHDKITGNLMAKARMARMALMAKWARDRQIGVMLLGHTADDLAENLLMRAMRGAGIDGLSAMADRRQGDGVIWLRPLLTAGRDELRDYLRQIGGHWIDDPSNDNPDFDRVRVRRVIADLGISTESLAQTARNLADARAALDHYQARVVQSATSLRGNLSLCLDDFLTAPHEIQRRVIIQMTQFVTGHPYPPRRSGVDQALKSINSGQRVTLQGTMIIPQKESLRCQREPAAALRSGPAIAGVWDNRWQVTGMQSDHDIGALG